MKIFTQKNSKVALLMALTATLTTLPGCRKDFLDRQPLGRYTADTYPYPGGSGPYDQFIFGAYADLRTWGVSVFSFLHAVSIRSDDADKGSTAADGGADSQGMDNFPVLPTNGHTNTLWTGYYSLINKANIVLDQVANNAAVTATPEAKMQAEAEAKFIRGYAYFMLVRLFGRVPIVDKIYTDVTSQSNIPQSTAAQVYAFIESDLKTAAAGLPATWDSRFTGRATSGAANGMLAKVYLYQQKWALALSTAQLVINSGVYDLSTPYAQIFSETGENSKESVFEIQATANATNPEAYGVQYTNVQGVRGTGAWDMGWGFNVPSTQLEAAYETGDPRRARTILYAGGTSIYGEAIPAGLPNPRYNNKVYTNPSVRSSVGNRFGWWMNVRILRYADVVLMAAEAANETGNATLALDYLERVRARARAGNAALLPRVTTTDAAALRTAIRQERRVELGMEHERFFDTVRWGIAQQVLAAAGKTNFNPARDVLLPIPQTQIDLSKGVLTQNPGY